MDLSPKGMLFKTNETIPIHAVIKIDCPELQEREEYAIGTQFLIVTFKTMPGHFFQSPVDGRQTNPLRVKYIPEP